MQTMSGTLYLPAISLEMNTAGQFERRVATTETTYTSLRLGRSSSLVTRTPAQCTYVQDNCIDYIFTDPPFGSNIFYADCSFLWECWLGYHTDERYEAV